MFTERTVRVWASNLEYLLWNVLPDFIAFARDLDMGMLVALGLRENVRELLEMLEVTELSRFDGLGNTYCERTFRS